MRIDTACSIIWCRTVFSASLAKPLLAMLPQKIAKHVFKANAKKLCLGQPGFTME